MEKIIEHIELAKAAALAAGKEILDVYESSDFGVQNKDDNSPLTIADKKAHLVICDYLEQTGLPILSEEGSKIPYEERKSWEYFWMVDPLDGTKEFIKRNGEFTVNIALIYKNKPIMGVVYVPVQDKLFFGDIENGAFCEKDSSSQAMTIEEHSLTDANLRVVASRSHLNAETSQFLESLDSPEIVSMGSSLKFMAMTEQLADIYPRFAPTMEWDTAAAHAIVNAAGGHVYQKDSSEELVYNKEDLLNPFFLSYNKRG